MSKKQLNTKKSSLKRKVIVALTTLFGSLALIAIAYIVAYFAKGPEFVLSPASSKEFKSFHAKEIKTKSKNAEAKVDHEIAEFVKNTDEPVAKSKVDACYQRSEDQGWVAREYRKHCYHRQVLVVPVDDDWKGYGRVVIEQLDSMGYNAKLDLEQIKGGCYQDSVIQPSIDGRDDTGTEVTLIDLFAGPVRGDNNLCEPDEVEQVRASGVIAAVDMKNDFLFNEKDLFNSSKVFKRINTNSVMVIGFTEEYFNERIKP